MEWRWRGGEYPAARWVGSGPVRADRSGGSGTVPGPGTGLASGGISAGRFSGTRSRQFWSEQKAAALTRGDVSGGALPLASPATHARSASMISLLQQHPLLSARAAASRTHSLGSSRSE